MFGWTVAVILSLASVAAGAANCDYPQTRAAAASHLDHLIHDVFAHRPTEFLRQLGQCAHPGAMGVLSDIEKTQRALSHDITSTQRPPTIRRLDQVSFASSFLRITYEIARGATSRRLMITYRRFPYGWGINQIVSDY